jgi:hypothetical protein
MGASNIGATIMTPRIAHAAARRRVQRFDPQRGESIEDFVVEWDEIESDDADLEARALAQSLAVRDED